MYFATIVIFILAAVIVFLLVKLRVSHREDGTLTVTSNNYGSTITLNVAPSDLIDKKYVILKVTPPSVESPPPEAA